MSYHSIALCHPVYPSLSANGGSFFSFSLSLSFADDLEEDSFLGDDEPLGLFCCCWGNHGQSLFFRGLIRWAPQPLVGKVGVLALNFIWKECPASTRCSLQRWPPRIECGRSIQLEPWSSCRSWIGNTRFPGRWSCRLKLRQPLRVLTAAWMKLFTCRISYLKRLGWNSASLSWVAWAFENVAVKSWFTMWKNKVGPSSWKFNSRDANADLASSVIEFLRHSYIIWAFWRALISPAPTRATRAASIWGRVDLSVVVEKVVGCTRDGDRDDAMGGRIPSACLRMILEVGQEQMKILDFPSELGSKGFTTLLEQACSSPRGQINGISFIWGDMVRDDRWRNCCGSGRWRRCSSGGRRKSLDGLSQLLSSCVIHVAVLQAHNDNDEALRRLQE